MQRIVLEEESRLCAAAPHQGDDLVPPLDEGEARRRSCRSGGADQQQEDGSGCVNGSVPSPHRGGAAPLPPGKKGESSAARARSAAGTSPRSRSERRRRSVWLNWRGERSRAKPPRAETPTARGNRQRPPPRRPGAAAELDGLRQAICLTKEQMCAIITVRCNLQQIHYRIQQR